jgi:hypothetical protein
MSDTVSFGVLGAITTYQPAFNANTSPLISATVSPFKISVTSIVAESFGRTGRLNQIFPVFYFHVIMKSLGDDLVQIADMPGL